ncbi:PilX N-terminal domain-containing pilus assembly protein, partial [Planctomycetota bacterium]
MQFKNRKPAGIVLIVVLGVLALLSVLAITFVSMTRLERSISRNYVDRTRAILAAESGIEYAIRRLANFRGGVLLPEELAALQYQEGDCHKPLAQVDNPCFAVPGKTYSGLVAASHAGEGDRFKLDVQDLTNCINLNDGNEETNLPESDPFCGSRRQSMMVSYLCEDLFKDNLGIGIGGTIATEIEMAKDEHPGGCFSSMNEIKDILVDEVGFSEDDWFKFRRYFTIYNWQDSNVLLPTFAVDITVPDGMEAPLYDDGGADVYLYMDMQTKRFDLSTRSPVNINTTPRETLKMLFALVTGWYLKEGPGERISDGHYGDWKIVPNYCSGKAFQYYFADEDQRGCEGPAIGKQNSYGIITRTEPITDLQADEIAFSLWDRIHVNNNPIETWDEFEIFLKDELNPDMSEPLDEYEIDAFLANFNPNSQINDYNPNMTIYRHVDKSQLVTYTTEFCFEPTGYFDIRSYGEILDSSGVAASSVQINTVVKVFEYFRQTTQQEFMAGYQQESDLAYFFSESESLTTALSGLSSSLGYALQSYPEPVTDENYMSDSYYDGKLMLATWQPELDEYQLDVSEYMWPMVPIPIFRSTFMMDINPEDYGNNPETGGDIGVLPEGGWNSFYVDKGDGWPEHLFNRPTNGRLTYDLSAEDPVPGVVFPDGALSDACRSIGFGAGNFGKSQGNVSGMHFWIKPNFDPANSTRVRQILSFYKNGTAILGPAQLSLYYFSNNNHNNEINMSFYGNDNGGSWAPTRSFVTGWGFSVFNAVGLYSPTVNHNFPDHSDAQHGIYPEYNFEGHQWNHIGLSWNTYGSSQPDSYWFLTMSVNGELVDPTRWGQQGYFSHQANMWGRLRRPNVVRFGESVLGHTWYPDGTQNYVADSTIDDIVGHMDYVPMDLYPQFYRWGRYYNMSGATYDSPAIDLHAALKLDRREVIRPRSVSWTVYWPSHNRDGDQVVDNILPANVNGDALDIDNPSDPVPDDPMAA